MVAAMHRRARVAVDPEVKWYAGFYSADFTLIEKTPSLILPVLKALFKLDLYIVINYKKAKQIIIRNSKELNLFVETLRADILLQCYWKQRVSDDTLNFR